MLIAIMGDSFAKVIENKDINSIKMKLQILGDLSPLFYQQDQEEKTDTIMLVARSIEAAGDDGDEWEGSLKKLTRLIESQSCVVQNRLKTEVAKLQTTIEENFKKDSIKDRQTKV